MASIGKEPNGRKRLLFVAEDGSRKTIRLGKMTAKQADAFKAKLESLLAWRGSGRIEPDTARWLMELPEVLHNKLVGAALVHARETRPPREEMTVAALCDEYAGSRDDVKKSTAVIYRLTGGNLKAFFGADKPIRTITEYDAERWRRYLAKESLSEATARKRAGVAKQIFRTAVKRKLIEENPFACLKSSAVGNDARQYFVGREDVVKVLDACPDLQWRLIVALARFGGLRCPSEILRVKWTDVDWSRSRFLVHSSKTERYEGKDCRWVPMFPELRSHLEQAFDGIEAGASEYVITRYRLTNSNLRTQFNRIIRRAGLKPWPRLFQNLRSTRQTELAESFPLHVVTAWIGNSQVVAKRHYLQVTDEHFEKAAGKSAQNPAQSAAVCGGTARSGDAVASGTDKSGPDNSADLPCVTAASYAGHQIEAASPFEGMRPAGFEPTTPGLGNRCSILLSYGRIAIDTCHLASSAGGCQMRSSGFAEIDFPSGIRLALRCATIPPQARATIRSAASSRAGARLGHSNRPRRILRISVDVGNEPVFSIAVARSISLAARPSTVPS